MDTRSKERNSNLEILRIISMILIIAHHYSVHGCEAFETEYSLNRYIIGFLSLGGKFGISCFILISGYYMIYSKFTLRKYLKLLGEVWFYSVFIGLMFFSVLIPVEPIGLKSVIKMFVPIGYAQYGFVTNYIVLMVISPLLNLLMETLNKVSHKNIILFAVLFWSIIPSFTKAEYGFSDLCWYIILYITAGYIRKYVDESFNNSEKHLLVGCIAYGLLVLSNIVLIFIRHSLNNAFIIHDSRHFSVLNSPFVFVASIEIFIAFIKKVPYCNVRLNKAASATFGVYLIHDNPFLRPYLWQTILKTPEIYPSNFLIVHAVFSIFGIYIVCSFIDLLRQITIERLYLNFLNRNLSNIEEFLVGIYMRGKAQCLSLMHSYYSNQAQTKS